MLEFFYEERKAELKPIHFFFFLQRFSEFFYEEREAELKPGPGSYHSALSWVAPTVIKDFGSEPARPLSHKVCVGGWV